MKILKAAAVVAGSMAVAGAAAPAFAHDAADVMPLRHQSNALDTENRNSALNTVKGVTGALNRHTPLLGGLPLHR